MMGAIQADGRRKVARRDFLKGAGAVAAGTAALRPALGVAGQPVKGANEVPGVGFIGTGGRCGAHINIVNELARQGRCRPVAVCDVYGPRVEAAAKATGGSKIYRDYQELVETEVSRQMVRQTTSRIAAVTDRLGRRRRAVLRGVAPRLW